MILRTRHRAFVAVGGFFCIGTRVERHEVEVLLDDLRVEPGEPSDLGGVGGDLHNQAYGLEVADVSVDGLLCVSGLPCDAWGVVTLEIE